MQFFRPARTNPPSDPSVSFEAMVFPPPDVAASLRRGCKDCHSNQTDWPWYSNISPASWLIAQDVNRGRAHLNLSEWDRYRERSQSQLEDMCEQVNAGKMPLWYFHPLHPEARLSDFEITSLCALSHGEGAE
jgi:hypothetical protein